MNSPSADITKKTTTTAGDRQARGEFVIWIASNTSSTTTKNNINTREERESQEKRRGNGPHTEAGRRKAEAKAAKEEKEERRRERNRKKRKAYRSRQREKTWGPGSSKRTQWTKAESGSKKKKDSENGNKKAKKDPNPTHKTKKWKKPKNQEEWEASVAVALDKQSYATMESLFMLVLRWAVARCGVEPRRELTKQFRLLSIRFHPDKHPDCNQAKYKMAFQALNEAHARAKAALLDQFGGNAE
ncbi:expressed unknown protein [Seminavis robusta]|uniref:J domain-containing protein n=1 Tax=Seminavis robusta TaxID=568900 RepID=A0A9N8DMT7_9STRA|nr:expressed unknown protein [Seminavis robusta]|eukprot:Sro248_g098440.1 n/a (244) ;mRNA; f:70320-71319